ncbi:MAG: alpha/beta hydrolase [Pseudomonadota bacterium]
MFARLATRIDTFNGQKLARRFKSGWPSSSRPDIKFHKTLLAQYRYRERAPAENPENVLTIVLLADPPVTLERYDDLLESWGKRFRIVVFESAAMGFSAPEPGYDFTFRQTNDDVASFLRAIVGEKSILAFSCVSGLGAIDIAVRYPDLVRGLFLMQTADWETMIGWKKRLDSTGLLSKPVLGQMMMKRLGVSGTPGWFKQALGRRDQMGPFCDCAAEGFSHGAQFSLASAFQRYLTGPSPLGVPDQPVRVLWGARDASHDVVSSTGAEMVRMIAPQATFEALEHVGHFPELQDPDAVLQRIARFARAVV